MVGSSLTRHLQSLRLSLLDQLNVLFERYVAHVNVLSVQHSKHENCTEIAASSVDAERMSSRPAHDVFLPQGEIVVHDECAEAVRDQRERYLKLN